VTFRPHRNTLWQVRQHSLPYLTALSHVAPVSCINNNTTIIISAVDTLSLHNPERCTAITGPDRLRAACSILLIRKAGLDCGLLAVTPCGLVGHHNVSVQPPASIFRAEAAQSTATRWQNAQCYNPNYYSLMILRSWQFLIWSNQRRCFRVPWVLYWTISWASFIQFTSSHFLNGHVRQGLQSSVS
jgi:hypothetical protein